MANKLINSTLSEISMDISYGYTESARTEAIGPHFLRITDIQNGIVNWKTVPYCKIDPSKLEKYRLETGDIVVARTGNSTGENYIFTGISETVYASYLIRFKIDPEKADPFFVWYNMRSPQWWGFIESSKTGSAQAGANAKVMGRFPLLLPPLDDQKAIANVLGTIDDRIELNRQMNETLEVMAQALFKSWFVDFDPVIDNALVSGKEIPEELSEKIKARAALGDKRRTLPEEIRTLFPDEFNFSKESGWIPKGWKTGLLSDISKNPRRGVQAAEINMGTPYIGLQDMPQKSISLTTWGLSDEVTSTKFSFNRGEILFGKLRPYFHKVGIAPVDGVCSTDILVVLPKEEGWFSVVLGHVTSLEFIEYVTGASTGTKMPRTNWKDMGNYKILLPEISVAKILTEYFQKYIDKILLNIEQNQELSILRDTLLPKLLSGEIRIPDAEKLIERVDGL